MFIYFCELIGMSARKNSNELYIKVCVYVFVCACVCLRNHGRPRECPCEELCKPTYCLRRVAIDQCLAYVLPLPYICCHLATRTRLLTKPHEKENYETFSLRFNFSSQPLHKFL